MHFSRDSGEDFSCTCAVTPVFYYSPPFDVTVQHSDAEIFTGFERSRSKSRMKSAISVCFVVVFHVYTRFCHCVCIFGGAFLCPAEQVSLPSVCLSHSCFPRDCSCPVNQTSLFQSLITQQSLCHTLSVCLFLSLSLAV